MTTESRRTLGRMTVLAALPLVGAGASAGCDMSCDGGQWEDQPRVMCTPTGTAAIGAPASLALPASTSVVRGATCLDTAGGCTEWPFVSFESDATSTIAGISLEIRVPAADGPASYTLPVVRPPSGPAPAVLVLADYRAAGDNGLFRAFTVTSGQITVDRSTTQELRVSFSLTLHLADSGEVVTVDGSNDVVGSCHVGTVSVCVGGD
jgi:hypothetical protein